MPTTYNLRTANTTGSTFHTSTDILNMDTGTSSVLSRNMPTGGVNIAVSSNGLVKVFSTLTGVPGSANWANADYQCTVNVTATAGTMTYGAKTFGTFAGHFARTDGPPTADLETKVQQEASLSGTGLKFMSTGAWDPAAGSTTDRFEVYIAGNNASTMTVGTITATLDDGSSFAVWEATLPSTSLPYVNRMPPLIAQ